MKKVLLDTDIGSDIDNALCLAYLLAHPGCQLMGITTVSGESMRRAMLASVLCRVAGQDIPIFPGAERPLLTRSQQRRAPQAVALPHWDHQRDFPAAGSLDFMRDTIRANPGEVTLLCIGPLTNIALLFGYDPELPGMLDSLVLMSGLFMRRLGRLEPLEWNVRCDPYAAAMVYQRQVARHISIGADVTHEVSMSPETFRARCGAHALLKPVLDFAERAWLLERDLVFHDPLARTRALPSCSRQRGSPLWNPFKGLVLLGFRCGVWMVSREASFPSSLKSPPVGAALVLPPKGLAPLESL